MKKIVVIGDIHGLRTWEQIVEKHPDCKYVFLGDYNDPYGNTVSNAEVLDNFKRLIDFKLAHEEDVVLLLGNHDMHYFDVELATLGTRFNVELAFELMMLYDEYNHCFQNAFQFNHLLFTHAGVSEEWFTNAFKSVNRDEVAWQLNHCTNEQKKSLHYCGVNRGGDYSHGGIFWADKDEFVNPLEGYIQFVGHNRVQNIQEWVGTNGAKVFFCDSLHQGNYLIISNQEGEMSFGTVNVIYIK